MDIQRKTTAKQTTLKLSGDLTIYQAAEAKSRMLDNAKGLDRKVLLNMEGIESLDSAGVQLLLMLKKVVSQNSGELNIVGISESAARVLQILSCAASFGLEELNV